MKCLNCGMENSEGSKFCLGCSKSLQQNNNQSNNFETVKFESENLNVQNTQNYVQDSEQIKNTNQVLSGEKISYFAYIIALLLKPFKTFKEEMTKLSDTKNSFILTLIISVVMMLVNFIKTALTVIKSYDYWEDKTTWDFSRLKELDYVELIGKNLLIYICVILLLAVVFYLASLVAKKETKFSKLLSISTSSMIPVIALSLIISPIVGMIWVPLSMIAMVAGFIYGIVIFYELINDELKFEGDMKIYFNFICFVILICISLYASFKFMSTSSVDIDSVMGMLG